MNRSFSQIKSKFGDIIEISFVQMRVEVNVILYIFESKSASYNSILPTKNAPDIRKRLCF